MNALPFTITLEEPLLASALDGDPNSAGSYPFIPGSLIRGALVARFSRHHQDDNLSLTARDRFFNGRTRFLNAYPASDNGRRTLPIPLSWRVEKLDAPPKKLYDFTIPEDKRPTGYKNKLKQPRGVNKPFHYFDGQEVTLVNPVRRFNIHTHRENREMGRATDTEGGVFRYEALASGQVFIGLILFDDAPITDLLSNGVLYLGRSRSTAYGRVRIEVEDPVENWREIGGTLAAIETNFPAGDLFTLTLLSDLIAQNKAGQYITALTPDILTRWLGVSISTKRVFKADSTVGGFNRRWGLPLLQMPVTRAGSVYVLRSEKPIPVDTLRRLEAEGVGKRRVDGFGRVAFNWYGQQFELALSQAELSPQDETARQEGPAPVQLSGEVNQMLARTMRRRLMTQELEVIIPEYVHGLDLNLNNIKASQISRFRVVVRKNLTRPGIEAVHELQAWLEKMRPTGRKQFEKAAIKETIKTENGGTKTETRSLFDWLTLKLKSHGSVWDALKVRLEETPLAHFEGVGALDADTLAIQMTLRVIDNVLARFVKLTAKEARKNE